MATPTRIAAMGCAYGNRPALAACIDDARAQGCDTLVFLGDATGCCGHSDETLALIARAFDIRVAGNHEQEVAAGSDHCGCGYDDPEDERLGCIAHQYAMQSVSAANRARLAEWPEGGQLETLGGRLLLCHGSPAQTNEFLYESELDNDRLCRWLAQAGATGLVCTHTGLPWIRDLPGNRFAVNCGATGKPDHDGDPAVHYAVIDMAERDVRLRRVEYDHRAWAAQLRAEGVDEVFITPLETGEWTTGVNSLPEPEKPVQPRPLNLAIPGGRG